MLVRPAFSRLMPERHASSHRREYGKGTFAMHPSQLSSTRASALADLPSGANTLISCRHGLVAANAKTRDTWPGGHPTNKNRQDRRADACPRLDPAALLLVLHAPAGLSCLPLDMAAPPLASQIRPMHPSHGVPPATMLQRGGAANQPLTASAGLPSPGMLHCMHKHLAWTGSHVSRMSPKRTMPAEGKPSPFAAIHRLRHGSRWLTWVRATVGAEG